MSTLAVQFYDVVVWLHVSSVVVAFGPTFAFGVYLAFAGRNDPRSIPTILAAQTTINRSLVTIGGTLVLITGLYLVADRWDFSEFFVGWGIIAILVLLGLVHGVFIPNDRRAMQAAKRDIDAARGDRVELSSDFDRASRTSARLGPVAGLIIILTIYVMSAKPFL